MGIDDAAHELFDFRAQKYDEFGNGRFKVAYHEDGLYSVRDTDLKTVKLIRARSPIQAAQAIMSHEYVGIEPENGLWVSDEEYNEYLARNEGMRGEISPKVLREIAFNTHILAACYAEKCGYAPAKPDKQDCQNETTFKKIKRSKGENGAWGIDTYMCTNPSCRMLISTNQLVVSSYKFCPFCGKKASVEDGDTVIRPSE